MKVINEDLKLYVGAMNYSVYTKAESKKEGEFKYYKNIHYYQSLKGVSSFLDSENVKMSGIILKCHESEDEYSKTILKLPRTSFLTLKRTKKISGRMQLTDDFSIRIDNHNMTLEKNIGEPEKNKTAICGYFHNFHEICNYYNIQRFFDVLNDKITLEESNKMLDTMIESSKTIINGK